MGHRIYATKIDHLPNRTDVHVTLEAWDGHIPFVAGLKEEVQAERALLLATERI